MLSYVDDFALTAASLSYRGNIRRLQELFRSMQAMVAHLAISFSVLNTELIQWRTPSQRHSQLCLSPIQLDGEIFHPRDSLWWIGYWFTPSLSTSTHFARTLVLAQGAFALVRRLSPSGAGLAPYLCHRLATSLVAPILLYGADLCTPNVGSLTRLDTFWHKVLRWATTCFSLLPPIHLVVSPRQSLAALRTVCSLPGVNPATARLHLTFPTLSSYRALDSSRAHTKGLPWFYLTVSWKSPALLPLTGTPSC